MWKETLLQVMIALLPVFAFQMWYNRPDRYKGTPVLIGILCGISLFLCIAVSYETAAGFDLDIRVIPFIIGSLYGGWPIALLLSIVYALLRFPMLDSLWEQIGFAMFVLLFIPSVMLCIAPFQRGYRKHKQAIAISLGMGSLLFFSLSYLGYYMTAAEEQNSMMWFNLLIAMLVFSIIIALSVYAIESVKEKQLLHYQLQRMSLNYRNEVQKLQQFIDNTPLGVIIVDREGDITHINDMAANAMRDKLDQVNRGEVIGRPFNQLYKGINQDTNGKMMMNALRGNDTASEITHHNQKTYIKTGFSVRDMHNQDIIGAALIAHDITELSRLRDEVGRMERLSLVGQMAASITHEIRNPMAVIRGFVQLMQERSPDNQKEYFRIIMEELDRANGIINDFLSLAQNRIVEKESGSINDIINELMPLLWADANLRGQTINTELDDTVPVLDLNAKEIKQLILNLTRNAMEAMGDKGLLHIGTMWKHDCVELRVTDSGCGIPQEKQERLFEPFYTTKTRGTGLGLPLCLSIVERHNGKIEVDSKEGVGTTFIVTFQYIMDG